MVPWPVPDDDEDDFDMGDLDGLDDDEDDFDVEDLDGFNQDEDDDQDDSPESGDYED